MTSTEPTKGSVPSNLVRHEGPPYYYSLWIKHISQYLDATGSAMPKAVVEIGPGASLGAGLSALLSGAERYYGFDLVRHTNVVENQEVLQALVKKIRKRDGVKNATGFPNYVNVLNEKFFPERFITEALLEQSLSDESIRSISSALTGESPAHITRYVAPWEDPEVYGDLRGEIDFVFSHSVMEHLDDIERAYQIMGELCKPGGGMSHQIDFRSHGFSRPWNAYRKIDDSDWSALCEGNPYAINREPPSRHIDLIERNGFRIVRLIPRGQINKIPRNELICRFRDLPDTDLVWDGLMIQAVRTDKKPGS